ncbi:1-hydroxycarotenoid 3,4-desaturase CrtD [Sphingomonas sp.]
MPREHLVIVGGGVGGLVAAALAARGGAQVTLCEAAPRFGGKLRALDVGGAAVDGGPTVFTLRSIFDDLFAHCGDSLDRHLALRPAEILARHAWGGDRFDLLSDEAATEAEVARFAGNDALGGYRAFRAEARRIHAALDRSFLRAQRTDPVGLTFRLLRHTPRDVFALRPYETLWKALGQHFADPRLRQLFGRYATYCGSSPFTCPATLMLIADVERQGVWLVEGGMHRLADALTALAMRQGATLRSASPVARILADRGQTRGIVLASGEHIAADAVIVNADPAAIAAGRFGSDVRHAVRAVPPARRSLSALVWLARGRANGFDLARHNVFFSPDYADEFAALAAGRSIADPSVYVCAQDRGEGLAPPVGEERFQIIVNAAPSGNALGEQESQICTTAMERRLAASGLTIERSAMRLLTPQDFERLCPSTGGALYGRASHGWAASFLRQGCRTAIAGLYCAGGSCHPGAGVPMAALSASLAVDMWRRDRASIRSFLPMAMPGGISTRPAQTVDTG